MKLIKEPTGAKVRCPRCGRIYLMDHEEYNNTFVSPIDAQYKLICKCGGGRFELMEIEYKEPTDLT